MVPILYMGVKRLDMQPCSSPINILQNHSITRDKIIKRCEEVKHLTSSLVMELDEQAPLYNRSFSFSPCCVFGHRQTQADKFTEAFRKPIQSKF